MSLIKSVVDIIGDVLHLVVTALSSDALWLEMVIGNMYKTLMVQFIVTTTNYSQHGRAGMVGPGMLPSCRNLVLSLIISWLPSQNCMQCT